MGVPCSGCGRQYDVTLFAFGRTLHCACGRRVALEPRVRHRTMTGEPRFFADAMLGRLAQWLRILGFDCAYEREIDDGLLVRRALGERRIVLTRDRALPEEWHIEGYYLVGAESVLEQLQEVVRRFELAGRLRLFTRCARCNAPLEAVSRQKVAARVPPHVFATRDAFRRCPGCERVYWEGTHTERMRALVDRVLSG